jgi:site-specific recombinase XerD
VSDERRDLAVVGTAPAAMSPRLHSSLPVPALIANAGDRASRRFLDFFAASINNDNTRVAYYRAVCNFFAWLEQHGIGGLPDIEPFHVAAYLKALETTAAKPTVKQNLAAVRMLFDWLIVGQVLAINPAHAVRGPKHLVSRGKTPVLTEEEARRLLASIKVTKKVKLADGSEEERPSVVGLRDRALLAVMTYSFARISAVIGMKVEDYFANGKRWWVRLYEKGGKVHEMPAHHKLEQYLDEYLEAASIRDQGKTPLFRSTTGRTGLLTDRSMHRVDAYLMVRRRTAEAGLKGKLGCHMCRATGITAYLEGGGTLENAQKMAAHSSPRTTKLYDRRGGGVTLDEVERINILLATGAILLATTQFLPQLVEQDFGYTATWAGLVLSPGGLVTMVMMFVVGRLSARVQPKYLIVGGGGAHRTLHVRPDQYLRRSRLLVLRALADAARSRTAADLPANHDRVLRRHSRRQDRPGLGLAQRGAQYRRLGRNLSRQ